MVHLFSVNADGNVDGGGHGPGGRSADPRRRATADTDRCGHPQREPPAADGHGHLPLAGARRSETRRLLGRSENVREHRLGTSHLRSFDIFLDGDPQ